MSELWVMLVLWARFLSCVEDGAILQDVSLVKKWNSDVGLLPSLVHDVGKLAFALDSAITGAIIT